MTPSGLFVDSKRPLSGMSGSEPPKGGQNGGRFRYWNSRRRWMGNLVPAIVWLPLTVAGVLIVRATHEPLGSGFIMLLAGQLLTWIVLNYTGLWDNKPMRRALFKEFQILRPNHNGWRLFVGYASGPYSSWLDPHEDVGYCCLTGDTFEFYGDAKVRVVRREDVKSIHWKPNVHTLMGLGRWIVIDVVEGGRPISLKFEPRDRDTLIGNLLLGRKFKQRLENWRQKKTSPGYDSRGR